MGLLKQNTHYHTENSYIRFGYRFVVSFFSQIHTRAHTLSKVVIPADQNVPSLSVYYLPKA